MRHAQTVKLVRRAQAHSICTRPSQVRRPRCTSAAVTAADSSVGRGCFGSREIAKWASHRISLFKRSLAGRLANRPPRVDRRQSAQGCTHRSSTDPLAIRNPALPERTCLSRARRRAFPLPCKAQTERCCSSRASRQLKVLRDNPPDVEGTKENQARKRLKYVLCFPSKTPCLIVEQGLHTMIGEGLIDTELNLGNVFIRSGRNSRKFQIFPIITLPANP